MPDAKSPRYQGKISTWKDDQGYGFIAPNGGGPTVFVHIKSFASQGRRPAGNEVVTYELTTNGKGQPRAENVAYVRLRTSHQAPVRTGTGSLVMAAGLVGSAFLAFIAACCLTGKLPALAFVLYLGMSATAFVAYAIDKSAAQNNRRRTRESTLQMLGLAGGWPGAFLAQQVLRHKCNKRAFQQTFWLTVVAHCVALGWVLSSTGSKVLQGIAG